jgi:acyl carrier protein
MNFSELVVVVKRVFPNESTIESSMAKKDIISWDSIGHLNLILEVEDEFRIAFSKEEIESVDTLQRLFDLIITKTSK